MIDDHRPAAWCLRRRPHDTIRCRQCGAVIRHDPVGRSVRRPRTPGVALLSPVHDVDASVLDADVAPRFAAQAVESVADLRLTVVPDTDRPDPAPGQWFGLLARGRARLFTFGGWGAG